MTKLVRAALLTAVLGGALASLVGGSAIAAHDNCHDTRVIAAGPLYYEDRSTMDPVPGVIVGRSTWIYQESNGLAGLQHKKLQQSIILGSDDVEECTHPVGFLGTPDNMIF